MTRYKIPIEIRPLEEGGYLAVCPALQGCHAEGQTIAEAIDNLQDVARVLLELRAEDGLPVPDELTEQGQDRTLRGELEVAVGA
ncbi:MAG: type II toxin-antitoxin system HicB family antitoxin [Chloroflexi bacterium]|nr:type II toxin-antitoxin system HicB family antitoxin [Chloroflexota bacterium]